MIGMRYRDVRHGTHTIEDVLPKYKDAWVKKGGLVRENGLFPDAWLEKQDFVRNAQDPGWTAWASAYMNAWNSDLVRSLYDRQTMGYLTNVDGETRIHPPLVGSAIRSLAQTESLDPDAPDTLAKAKDVARKDDKPVFPYTKPLFGYTALWLSELGKKDELDSLLRYADERLSPTWEKGGLYYPRHDEPANVELEWTHMDPFSGNAAIGNARLNVEDGQKMMWEEPWTKETLAGRPWVDGVGLAEGVDFLRGTWDKEKGAVVMTMKSWDGSEKMVKPVVKNMPAGEWSLWVGGILARTEQVGKGGEVHVEVKVGGEEVDIVVVRNV